MKQPIFLFLRVLCFLYSSTLLAQNNNPLPTFLRKGGSLTVASTWHTIDFSTNLRPGSITFPTTTGYQIAINRYRRPIRRLGVEYGVGIGYHPIVADFNLKNAQYPSLSAEVQNLSVKTSDYYAQTTLKFYYLQPVSTRFSLNAMLGASLWVYKNGSSSRLISLNEAEKITVAWYNFAILVPKIVAGIGGQYQWSNHIATRALLSYDYGLSTSIEGSYSIYTNPALYRGHFKSKGNTLKMELGVIFTGL